STACQAQVSAASATVLTAPTVDEASRFVSTSAQVAAMCDNGTKSGCATRTSSTTETVAAGGTVRGKATATCAAAGVCQAATSGFALSAVTEVASNRSGTGCRPHTGGTGKAVVANGVNRASSSTDCTAGANGQCTGVSQVGASAAGAQVAASCQGSEGATCRQSIAASSAAKSTTGGNKAVAESTCGGTGGAGSGWCATSATAQTSDEQAMASAVCQGSEGSGCTHTFAASSKASSATGGNRATANAS